MTDSLWKSGEKPTVCIVCTSKNKYSETFIHAHVARLPAEIKVLYGWNLFDYRCHDDDKLLLSFTVQARLIRATLRTVFRFQESYFEESALRRFLKRNNVDVVLAEYGPSGVNVMDVCQEANIPLIPHFHGYDAYDLSFLESVGRRYTALFENAAAIVVVSRDMKHQLLHLGAHEEKLHLNPYGVDMSLFQNADPAHAPPLFVAVGRFVDKKAPHLTLLAFKEVIDRIPEARLVMIGNGLLWEACKQLAQGLSIAHAVQFLGALAHADVAVTMRKARVFVQHSVRTSYGDSEGTPVGVLEAGATGLPVVATRHAGIKDVVIDGETGLLVDEGDVDGMAEHMIRLAENPAFAAKLGKAARERISGEFSMEKSINNLWRIIESAISEHREP
jgi:glycosyltransferase involved in cell wall biosynthesis